MAEPAYFPPPEEFPGEFAPWHFSHAPLENVKRIQVFYEDIDYIFVKGMLIQYENGGQRSLGQCRLFVARSKTFYKPTSISVANITRPRLDTKFRRFYYPLEGDATRVLFDSVPIERELWTRSDMTGTIKFWFYWAETRIELC